MTADGPDLTLTGVLRISRPSLRAAHAAPTLPISGPGTAMKYARSARLDSRTTPASRFLTDYSRLTKHMTERKIRPALVDAGDAIATPVLRD